MESLVETENNIKRKIEHIDIPFMKEWEIVISGSDVKDVYGGQYETVAGIHIMMKDKNEWSTLTGVGFIKMMDFIENLIKSRNITTFTIDACDEKRQRVFGKWALRKGCTTEKAIDFFNDEVEVFHTPDYIKNN